MSTLRMPAAHRVAQPRSARPEQPGKKKETSIFGMLRAPPSNDLPTPIKARTFSEKKNINEKWIFDAGMGKWFGKFPDTLQMCRVWGNRVYLDGLSSRRRKGMGTWHSSPGRASFKCSAERMTCAIVKCEKREIWMKRAVDRTDFNALGTRIREGGVIEDAP